MRIHNYNKIKWLTFPLRVNSDDLRCHDIWFENSQFRPQSNHKKDKEKQSNKIKENASLSLFMGFFKAVPYIYPWGALFVCFVVFLKRIEYKKSWQLEIIEELSEASLPWQN